MKKPLKKPLHELLVAAGLAEDERSARALIMTGTILVNDVPIDKPGTAVAEDATLRIKGSSKTAFVGRGALKLQGAFEYFPLSVEGSICADIGASTGGFTQVLLKHGASRVYAIDVAYNELDYSLRNDSRVVCMERTDVRAVQQLPEPVEVISIDVSLLSVRDILPGIASWMTPEGSLICLFKPQYEIATTELPDGAVIQSPAVQEELLRSFLEFLDTTPFRLHGLQKAPLRGKKGNQEFLCWCRFTESDEDLRSRIHDLVHE